MVACLNDIRYIPSNNEQNEPTQRDIGAVPDCDFMTPLDFMEKFTDLKVIGKWTDSSFNDTLEFLQEAFPTRLGYKLSPSYYEIKKTFKMIKLCRWKHKNTTGKKVPSKVLRYFSIIHRLQCLYKSNHTAKHMTWPATGKSTENRLDADGFNPFGNLSQSYSIEDIDVNLKHLINDLKEVWKLKGETIDVITGTEFNIRGMLLWTINDFLAGSSLSMWSGKSYMACPTCNKETPSKYRQEMKKVIWCVLHNSPEINTYLAKFEREFPNSDMKQEFPRWFKPQTTTPLEGRQDVNHKKSSNGDVIVIEEDHDVIHDNNAFDLALFANLNDLEFATLNINGQSTEVEAPPPIFTDDYEDSIDNEDYVPYNLVDSDNEVLANSDDDEVATVVYSSNEED
ncbi:hypothetical protein Tco_1514868 [Tanacetum coccineum]